MDIRTLLVDAPYLFKRSLFGAKDTYTPEFGHIGGLYGFLTKIRSLIKQHQLNKIVLCWDGQNSGKARFLLDGNYKANRESKEWYNKIEFSNAQIAREEKNKESIFNQLHAIQTYAEELYFRQIEVDLIEADDLIAQYCMDKHNEEDIFIYTNDRDIAQMLDLNVTIIFGNIETPITKSNFIMHFNYHHSNVLTIKILTGDASDNIKGIRGLGEKGLIKKFPELTYKHMTVNEICNRGIQINKERVENKKTPLKVFELIKESREKLITNHKLINLHEPFLDKKAIKALETLDLPLDDDDRGSANLWYLMKRDGYMSVYGYDFVSYLEPFYPVIMKEKDTLKKYLAKYN